ncbi:MAG: response regulator transcription factor [Gammaproteobacteria bacterium]|nr:response regulator transcription factor [Gammaproteobacteria bacterium]
MYYQSKVQHQITREAIKRALETVKHIQVAGEAETGRAALKKLKTLRPDVILLDLNLPDISGIVITQRVHYLLPEARIIVLTAQQDITFPLRLFKVGAVGYLTKDQSATEMIDAIQFASARQRICSPRLTHQLTLSKADIDHIQHKLTALSNREMAVFHAIAKGKNSGMVQIRLTPHCDTYDV